MFARMKDFAIPERERQTQVTAGASFKSKLKMRINHTSQLTSSPMQHFNYTPHFACPQIRRQSNFVNQPW